MTLKEKTRLTAVILLGILASSCFAPTVRLTAWQISQPEELQDCALPAIPPLLKPGATVGETSLQTQTFSLSQQAALSDCRRKTRANSNLIARHNELVREVTKPKSWWDKIRGR